MDQRIIDEWAGALSEKLGRSTDEIRTTGLSAEDFSPAQRVELTLADKSFCRFNFAFLVLDEASRRVAVFTEHCGYHVFPLSEAIVKEIREDIYIDENYEP